MINLEDSINKQFDFNKGKNLFHAGVLDSLKFCPETIQAMEEIGEIDPGSVSLLIDYLTHRSIQEFCKINQYYTFGKEDRELLRDLYAELFSNIKAHHLTIDVIAQTHYDNLIKWLKRTNSFAEQIYHKEEENVELVVCSEYSTDLQINVLHLDIKQIKEPVLDIGCGRQGSLVNYLVQQGIEAYGFDRFAFESPVLSTSDWFEYHFEAGKWGTITSNLGFSNHFQHHHHRNDGSYINYAKKFMDILHSLKAGGSFHYAPDLPFIEQYLDKEKFQVINCSIGESTYNSTRIKRMR